MWIYIFPIFLQRQNYAGYAKHIVKPMSNEAMKAERKAAKSNTSQSQSLRVGQIMGPGSRLNEHDK